MTWATACRCFTLPAGGHDPVDEIDIRQPVMTARLNTASNDGRSSGWKTVPNPLHRDLGRGIELEDAEELLGPVVLVRHQIRDEAARFAQPLGFGETKVGLLDLRLRPFAILDVERGHIPSIDSSLIIEQRIVADQEPAIFAVLTQRALLIFERSGAFEGLPALLAQPFHIVRVVKPSAKVLFLHILQSDTVVIQHRLIHRQYGPIGSRHLDEGWDGVDGQAQIALARLQSLFSLLAIIDVCKEEIPGGYRTFRIPHWEAANLKPSVHAVSAPATVLNVIDLLPFRLTFVRASITRGRSSG